MHGYGANWEQLFVSVSAAALLCPQRCMSMTGRRNRAMIRRTLRKLARVPLLPYHPLLPSPTHLLHIPRSLRLGWIPPLRINSIWMFSTSLSTRSGSRPKLVALRGLLLEMERTHSPSLIPSRYSKRPYLQSRCNCARKASSPERNESGRCAREEPRVGHPC